MTTTPDHAIEAAATAYWGSASSKNSHVHSAMRDAITAFLTAMAPTHRMVPVEPTNAITDADAIHRAMIKEASKP